LGQINGIGVGFAKDDIIFAWVHSLLGSKSSNIRIQDIEKIDITGSGDNDLTLNLNDVLDASTSTKYIKLKQLVLFLFYKTTPTSC
jgi:hypothetical protein